MSVPLVGCVSATGRLCQCSCCVTSCHLEPMHGTCHLWCCVVTWSPVVLCCHMAVLSHVSHTVAWRFWSCYYKYISCECEWQMQLVPDSSKILVDQFHILGSSRHWAVDYLHLANNPSTCFPLQYVNSKPQP